jgi:NADPH-dependent ferric siderophore reductase
MTLAGLYTALNSLGMPVAYGSFPQPIEPPFIVYLFTSSDDMMADNQNYMEISNFQVELYTAKKDTVKEVLIQDKLKELRLPYQKLETWISSEKLYQNVYLIQKIGG